MTAFATPGSALHAAAAAGTRPQRLALVGCGAIAQATMLHLQGDPLLLLTQVVVSLAHIEEARAACARLAPQARVLSEIDLHCAERPHLVVECAGHGALAQHVLPALRAGIPTVLASIGALHDGQIELALAMAAAEGGARVHLVSGAVGGIDALAAARLGGLDSVQYIGRKPPAGWRGTPAEKLCDLEHLQEAVVIFHGSAREAARLYPKNANVAATVSLAGMGLDATQATLIADPAALRNIHRVVAVGAFGRLDMTIENEPLAANPRTSALTVYSIVRAIHNVTRPLAL